MKLRALAAVLSVSFGCATAPPAAPPSAPAEAPAPKPAEAKASTPADAKAFVDKLDAELKDRMVRSSTADWIRQTYITDDTAAAPRGRPTRCSST